MLGKAAAFAIVMAMALPAQVQATGDPMSYQAATSAGWGVESTVPPAEGSTDSGVAEPVLNTDQQTLMQRDADWSARANLYHAGGGGATGNDSLGCRPIAMRTVATDPRYIPRRTRLFIRETVGMRMPDGTVHDGYWYASDTGGAIKGQKIDLYTGHGRGSMSPAMRFNQRRLTIVDAGRFEGCPPSWDNLPSQTTLMASAGTNAGSN
ncbi:3D domain-containing protein [Brevundimonas sp.]|uniref:3D domain-containing protein n=1 Tax=Brevundimonas sp. TaxID=1871086 RepID=UPI002737C7B1|nr:3D domain-containing protein [Brevundimonas sp.]MDP3801390.1 3D domain-containing protein [Brevundimonas sp.]